MLERELRAHAFPTKYVGFIDLLGFSALTKEFPESLTLQVSEDYATVAAGTSKSAQRFAQFHAHLDWMAENQFAPSRPEQMMIFSDCAFAVYENPLQAAESLIELMRVFVRTALPVRMGIGKGTCHFERFGIDTNPGFTVTRSMFYGTGVVYATEAEKAGKGCRIFLHRSLDETDMASFTAHYPVLALANATEHCEYELNYSQAEDEPDRPIDQHADAALWRGLALLRSELPEPPDPDVVKHYDDSFAALDAMRAQHGLVPLPAWKVDQKGADAQT